MSVVLGNRSSHVSIGEATHQLVRETARAPFDVQAVAVPAAVVMSVCRQTSGGKQELLVHLLNASGAGVKKGDLLPARRDWKASAPFPPLAADLVFDLRAPGVRSAQIASPDYAGIRPVAVAPQGEVPSPS